MVAGAVAFILKGYPRLSETFIAQEIYALEQRGLDVRIVSLRHPTEDRRHPIHNDIAAPIRYLPEYLGDEPRRVLRAWWAMRRRPGYRAARTAWLRDLRREPTRNRVRRFGQALVLAHELTPDVTHLHAHFLHTPASVTRYAALLANRPWSCSAHAKDIWTSPEWDKREKLAEMAWLTTCTAYCRDHLTALAPGSERVVLAYHGLDLARLPPPQFDRPPRDGTDHADPIVLLSVGRAVEKKGLDVLLAALTRLPRSFGWRLVHIGDGPLLSNLQAQAAAAGLADRIDWLGPQAHETVFQHYRSADLFVLPCRVAANGDRDGLPNVLMEAQSQGLPCLTTDLPGIGELIEDGVTGRLVEPDDPQALATAISALGEQPALRGALARRGLDRLRHHFALDHGIAVLAQRFGIGATHERRLAAGGH